jgi:Ricin-type beta-trefoil lectin domain
VIIINKLSGNALEVEGLSNNQGARIQLVTRNGAASQRWFVKRTKCISYRSILRIVGREVLRYWPTLLRFPKPGYSVIADHSGLCLDIWNGSTDHSVAVQQFPVNGENNQLWAFVPDRQGFDFIVNAHTGQVLDVADNSLKNYATVQPNPFNGGDSQRWQLIN